jgi:parvulin-like peptidyl-prolyl isomerase
MMLSRGATSDTSAVREELLERLIDRALVRQFLKSRKTEADPKQLDEAVGQLKRQLRDTGKDPDAMLAELGYDDARVREDLSLTLAWQTHIRRIVTSDEIREYFASHREEFDGTEVRASQIFIKLPAKPTDGDVRAAMSKLEPLRDEITAGKLDFAEAAKMNSEAPSRDKGGDVGWFPYRGRMPIELSSVAFGLKKGEMSTVFRTPFGVHLLQTTDRKPGDLSVEDARPEIVRVLSDQHWEKVVASQRASAKIEKKPVRGD